MWPQTVTDALMALSFPHLAKLTLRAGHAGAALTEELWRFVAKQNVEAGLRCLVLDEFRTLQEFDMAPSELDEIHIAPFDDETARLLKVSDLVL